MTPSNHHTLKSVNSGELKFIPYKAGIRSTCSIACMVLDFQSLPIDRGWNGINYTRRSIKFTYMATIAQSRVS